MNVLISGASGFLGGWVVRELASSGHAVHGLGRGAAPPASLGPVGAWHVYDGSSRGVLRAVREAGADVVIHLAASSRAGAACEDVLPIVEPALVLGGQLLAAAGESGVVRFVSAGSYWEFGENGRGRANTLYAANKAAFRVLLDWYVGGEAFDGVTLALFDVYGPNDPRAKLLPRLVRALGTGERVPLSPGDQLLDMIHVRDAARAFVRAAEGPPGSSWRAEGRGGAPVFGVGTGRQLTLREIAAMLETAAGKRLNIAWGETAYPTHQIMRPIATLPPLPGWRAETTLEAGLAEVLRAAGG